MDALVNATPHMSFVRDDINADYLPRCFQALQQMTLFQGMPFSTDQNPIKQGAMLRHGQIQASVVPTEAVWLVYLRCFPLLTPDYYKNVINIKKLNVKSHQLTLHQHEPLSRLDE